MYEQITAAAAREEVCRFIIYEARRPPAYIYRHKVWAVID
jgi:hypothetical protein